MRIRKPVRPKINKRIIGSILLILLLGTVFAGTDVIPGAAQAPGDFPTVRLTGLDSSGAILPTGATDQNWRIQRIFNERASEGWSTCQYRNGDEFDDIDNGPQNATVVEENQNPGPPRDWKAGRNFGSATNAQQRYDLGTWRLANQPNSRWIGQNRYGRSEGNGYGSPPPSSHYCYDPGYSAGSPNLLTSNRQWGGSRRPSDVSSSATSPVLFDRTGPPPPYIPDRNINNYVFRYTSVLSDINLTNIDPDTISLTIRGTADDLIGIAINGVPLDIDCGSGPSTRVARDTSFNVPICSPGFDTEGTFIARVRPGTFDAAPGRRAGEIQTFDVYVKSAYSNTGFMFTDISWDGDPYVVTATCGSASIVQPGVKEPGQSFDLRVSVEEGTQRPNLGRVRIEGTSPGNTYSDSTDVTFNRVGGSNTFTATVNDVRLPAADIYKVSWTAGRSGTSSRDNLLNDCEDNIEIMRKPYMRVFGNDVAAGSYFRTTTGCSPTPASQNSGIFAFTSFDTWRTGAGTQLAAFATGQMRNFLSSTNRLIIFGDTTPPKNPSGLSFSNTGTSPSDGLFGTASGIQRCIPNYYSVRPAASIPAENVYVYDDGNPNRTWNLSTQPTPGDQHIVASGRQEVHFVNGNMLVQGTINLGGPAASISQVPSFHLIVRGDIYINSNVDTLNGVFVAQQRSDGTGGRIFTCTNGPNLWQASELSDQCAIRLKVSGDFIAHEVKFLRTGLTVRQSNNGEYLNGPSAERFIFSPEIYLAPQPRIFRSLGSAGSSDYDQLINLPPIL